MPRTKHLPFRKNLLAIAVGAALAPGASWALELVQAYFKSRLNLPVSGAAERSAELARRGVAPELVEALTAYVAELDQAVYTGQGEALAGLEIKKLIERLDKELA